MLHCPAVVLEYDDSTVDDHPVRKEMHVRKLRVAKPRASAVPCRAVVRTLSGL